MGPEYVNCPHCGAQNPAAAFFCGECGRQVRSLVAGKQGPVDEVGGEIQLGSILDDDGQAGQQYAPPEAQPVEPVTPGPSAPPVPGFQPPPLDPPPLNISAQPYQQPPPSPGGYPPNQPPPGQQPYQPPSYQPPYQPQQPYQQHPGGYPPPSAPGWDSGNTSGMGPDYPAPPEAGKRTCAGCIPFGIFAFANSATIWGVIGLLGIIPYVGSVLALVYAGYIFSNGRKIAWQSRRFDSIQQYSETMESWHKWGIGCLVLNLIATVIFVIAGIATNGFEG